MAWRQGQRYWEDLRARVLTAVDAGMMAQDIVRLVGEQLTESIRFQATDVAAEGFRHCAFEELVNDRALVKLDP